MSILIKNGEIITPTDRYFSDIYIENGTIKAIGKNLEKPHANTRVIDAHGHLVFPGAVDAHVHMELPFMSEVTADDFETGTAAGIAGGTTSIIDFVIPAPKQSLLDALHIWRERAQKSVADYAFHMAVTGYGDNTAKEMEQCVMKEGIPSFKTFMAYRGVIGVDDRDMIQIMETAKQLKALVTAHCENGDMVASLQNKLFAEGKIEPKYHALSRPAPVEGEATMRAITLARMTGIPLYVVHVTAKEAVDAIAEARLRGQTVFGETCPQYLLLDESEYDKPDFEGAAYVMSPPLRSQEHREALWAGLKSGIIQTVATDHCPFNQTQRKHGIHDFRKIPNGAVGIQNRLSLMYTYGVLEEKITLHQFVELNCARPAKLFGMYPRKGAIMVDADADIVIWDPTKIGTISAKTHFHNCDRNVFEGFKTQGEPAYVIANGKVQFEQGKLDVERGAGRYIPRHTLCA